MTRIRPEAIELHARIAQDILDAGMTPIVWGLMWPGIRRGGPTGYTWQGLPIDPGHWYNWLEPAPSAWLNLWRKMMAAMPDGVKYVDGVEAFTNPNGRVFPGPPANPFQNDMLLVTPDCYQSDGGGSGERFERPDVHINPGDDVHWGSSPTGGILSTDGWGDEGGTTWEDGRGFAGLPPGNLAAVKDWFDYQYRMAHHDGREFFMVLHTTGWGVKSHAQATAGVAPERPVLRAIDVEPFGDVYRHLAQLELGDASLPDDEIDLREVTWAPNMSQGVATFRKTSTLIAVDVQLGYIDTPHTKNLIWPMWGHGDTNANPIVFAKIDGQWHGGTYEWIEPHGPEGTRKSLGSLSQKHPGESVGDLIGDHVKMGPLATWRPQPGEMVGFMVATPCRLSARTIDERTNVVLIQWPADV